MHPLIYLIMFLVVIINYQKQKRNTQSEQSDQPAQKSAQALFMEEYHSLSQLERARFKKKINKLNLPRIGTRHYNDTNLMLLDNRLPDVLSPIFQGSAFIEKSATMFSSNEFNAEYRTYDQRLSMNKVNAVISLLSELQHHKLIYFKGMHNDNLLFILFNLSNDKPDLLLFETSRRYGHSQINTSNIDKKYPAIKDLTENIFYTDFFPISIEDHLLLEDLNAKPLPLTVILKAVQQKFKNDTTFQIKMYNSFLASRDTLSFNIWDLGYDIDDIPLTWNDSEKINTFLDETDITKSAKMNIDKIYRILTNSNKLPYGTKESPKPEFVPFTISHFSRNASLSNQLSSLINDQMQTLSFLSGIDPYKFEHVVGAVLSYDLNIPYSVTKKSGDQGVDIILENNITSIGVQVKRYKNSVGNAAIQEVVAGEKLNNYSQSIVVTTSTFTRSAITLADANSVQLIDGKSLYKIFARYLPEKGFKDALDNVY